MEQVYEALTALRAPLQQGEYQQYQYAEAENSASAESSQQEYGYTYEPYATRRTETPAGDAVKNAAASSLFMAICVTLTAGAFLPMLHGGFNIIALLYSLAAWMVFTAANKPEPMPVGGFRVLCGTIKAERILCWVMIVILLVSGVLSLIGLSAVDWATLLPQLQIEDPEFYQFLKSNVDNLGMMMSGIIFGTCFIAAAVLLVMNITVLKHFQKLARSFYNSIESGTLRLEKASACFKWLIAGGVLAGIGAFSNTEAMSLISSLAMAASYIMLAVWLNRSFIKKQ